MNAQLSEKPELPDRCMTDACATAVGLRCKTEGALNLTEKYVHVVTWVDSYHSLHL